MEDMMGNDVTSPVMGFISCLQKEGGLKATDIANFTKVSKATVSRWTSGQKTPHPKTQLILSDLDYVVKRLTPYYTPEEIRTWLSARHPQLEGRRAVSLIFEGESEAVVSILDRLDADAYL
jgi:transcriptional regulator with XRE-family HTH domain